MPAVLLLLAVATVCGIGGDVACKVYCRDGRLSMLLLAAAAWVVQCGLWIPIYRRSPLAIALTISSALWLGSSAAIGVWGLGEALTWRGWLGMGCCAAAIVLLAWEGT